jgi:hypothetical protein
LITRIINPCYKMQDKMQTMKEKKKSISYVARWGHPRYRPKPAHARRKARRERAYARGASKPQPKAITT